MKSLIITLFLLTCTTIIAATSDTMIRLLSVEGRPAYVSQSTIFRFTDDESSLDLELLCPDGKNTEFTAMLWLEGGNLATPFAQNLTIHKDLNPGQSTEGIWKGRIELPVKDLQPGSRVRLQLDIISKNQTAPRLSDVSFTIHLVDKKALGDTFKSVRNQFRFAVFGNQQSVRNLLKHYEIPFEDWSEQTRSDIPPNTIIIGCAKDSSLPFMPPPGSGLFVYAPSLESPFEVISESKNGAVSCIIVRSAPASIQSSPTDAQMLIHFLKNLPLKP